MKKFLIFFILLISVSAVSASETVSFAVYEINTYTDQFVFSQTEFNAVVEQGNFKLIDEIKINRAGSFLIDKTKNDILYGKQIPVGLIVSGESYEFGMDHSLISKSKT